MKRTITIVALLLTACKESPTAPAAPGLAYVNAMMDIMQANSRRRAAIDWTNFRSQVVAAVPSNASISDSFTAIFLALELLGDNHSFYTSTGGVVLYASTLNCSAPTITGVPPLGSDIGYVRIGGFEGTSAAQLFTDSIVAAIRAVDGPQVRGWIVDLRGNDGGNMWPMVAGVGSILGDGTAGYFVFPNGPPVPWAFDGRESLDGGVVEQAATAPYTLLSPSPRVAVLLDRRVASSGEAVAVAFKQRSNTRFFGTGTCGLSTVNAGYTLSDGAVLELNIGTDADRTSTLYGGPVLPDSVITDTSAGVPAAVAWLRSSHP